MTHKAEVYCGRNASEFVYSVAQEPIVFQNSDILDFVKGAPYIYLGKKMGAMPIYNSLPPFVEFGIWWNHQQRSVTSCYKQTDSKVLL